MKNYRYLVLFVLLISVIAAGCSGTSNNQKSTKSSETHMVSQPQSAESSFKTYNIGETTTDGLTKITVNNERYSNLINERPEKIEEAGNGYKFLIMNITLENISPNRSRTYAYMQYKILSSDGSTYKLDDNATDALSKPIDVVDVPPSNIRKGELAFKVPSNGTGLQFEFVYDPLNSADSAVYNL